VTSAPAVRIEGLRCRVGSRITLDVEHLRIEAGERVALIGPNGAGKSTLLRCLNGFTRPAEGRVEVLGHALGAGRPPARRLRMLRADVGHVMQGLHLVQRLSALENVLIGALARVTGWRSWLRLYPPGEIAGAEAALARVGLAVQARHRTDRLSGGERQKTAIARMLVQQPRLILADEPTASLDPAAAREICSLLAGAAEGATLISVVHSPALLPLLADRVVALKGGRIEFDLPISAVDDARLAELYQVPADTP
jgi:phosphonate transport system ATP-binding protein